MKRLIIIGCSLLTLLGVLLVSAVPASAIGTCSATQKSTVYVICVDNHSKNTQTMWVIDKSGKTVYGPVTVTTSQIDSDGAATGDTLTRNGHWLLGTPQLKTSIGLRYYIPFAGSQGFHYYRQVGRGYDSHGCVREDMTTAKWVYDHIGKAILAGQRAEADIMS
jgi:hypothetical protein